MAPLPRRHWLGTHQSPASVAPSGPRESCALTLFFLIVAVIYLPHSAGSARRALPLHTEAQANCCGQEDDTVTHPAVANTLLPLFMKINLYQFRILWLMLWIRIWTESHCPRFLLLFHLGRPDVLTQSIFLPFDCQQMFIYLFIYFPMQRLNSISWIQDLGSGCWSEQPGWGGAPAIVPFQGCQSEWWLLGPLITSSLFAPCTCISLFFIFFTVFMIHKYWNYAAEIQRSAFQMLFVLFLFLHVVRTLASFWQTSLCINN